MRKHPELAALVLASVAGVAGCSDELLSPVAPVDRPAFAATVETGDQLVLFSNGVPADFAARVAALGGSIRDVMENIGVAVVSDLSSADVAALRAQSGISGVGPDALVALSEPTILSVEQATSAEDPTTAFFYPRQWHLRAIGADKAWAAGKLGSPAIRVAILDTGIDYLHPDLAGRVDLSRSISFVESDDALVDYFFLGRNHVTDLHFHGTHVAATVSSNGLAAAGVTSRVTLMAVKVLGVNGTGFTSDVLAGIEYATDNGAHVINLSLGGAFDRAQNPEAFRAVEQALFYALRRGVLVVAAAGNAATDINGNGTIYETYCESLQVMCVTATGPTAAESINGPWTDVDAFAPYSNFGKFAVSVAAPGGNAGGGVWAGCSQTSLQIPACGTGVFVLGLAGTSQAAPHASGLAALLAEKYGRNGLITRLVISANADDRGARGRDPFYGWGRINVGKALGLGKKWSWD
jgi:subtilisin family serine protease